MALDTKYRPRTYGDVLGQDATVSVLRQFIVEGRGFHQSYVFCGQHGSGKTTLGRILARALLCEAPSEGSPCDECLSCRTLLDGDSHECFVELDAATKSGKADLVRILEDVQYSTVSGKRRIYLFDESHRLSKQALDALLKPMEDSAPGSEDKRLVCIFCTTEQFESTALLATEVESLQRADRGPIGQVQMTEQPGLTCFDGLQRCRVDDSCSYPRRPDFRTRHQVAGETTSKCIVIELRQHLRHAVLVGA